MPLAVGEGVYFAADPVADRRAPCFGPGVFALSGSCVFVWLSALFRGRGVETEMYQFLCVGIGCSEKSNSRHLRRMRGGVAVGMPRPGADQRFVRSFVHKANW